MTLGFEAPNSVTSSESLQEKVPLQKCYNWQLEIVGGNMKVKFGGALVLSVLFAVAYSQPSYADRAAAIAACGTATTDTDAKAVCFRSSLSAEAITACGRATTNTDSKIACFRSALRADAIYACGRITRNTDVKIACFRSALDADSIYACGQATQNVDTKIACLGG
jgi:hypothetical protein